MHDHMKSNGSKGNSALKTTQRTLVFLGMAISATIRIRKIQAHLLLSIVTSLWRVFMKFSE